MCENPVNNNYTVCVCPIVSYTTLRVPSQLGSHYSEKRGSADSLVEAVSLYCCKSVAINLTAFGRSKKKFTSHCLVSSVMFRLGIRVITALKPQLDSRQTVSKTSPHQKRGIGGQPSQPSDFIETILVHTTSFFSFL